MRVVAELVQELASGAGVAADLRELRVGEPAGLVEDLVGHRQLAHVMEQTAEGQLAQTALRETEALADRHRQQRDTPRVALGGRVLLAQPEQDGPDPGHPGTPPRAPPDRWRAGPRTGDGSRRRAGGRARRGWRPSRCRPPRGCGPPRSRPASSRSAGGRTGPRSARPRRWRRSGPLPVGSAGRCGRRARRAAPGGLRRERR